MLKNVEVKNLFNKKKIMKGWSNYEKIKLASSL